MKNLCFFSGDITRGGGTERVAIAIANELVKKDDIKIEFLSLVEQNKKPFYQIDDRIKRYALGSKWKNPGPGYLTYLPKLRKYLKEHSIDIIIDIDIVLDSLSIPSAKKTGTKVITWEHFNCNFEISVFYRRLIAKYAVKHADYIVTLTQRDARCFTKKLGRVNNIGAIHNPIMMEPVTLGKVPRENWIVTAGRLVYQKGIEYLAEVAVPVLQKHPDWKWIVLGEGPDRKILEETIQQYHLENQLVLKGQVKNIEEYLQRAKIYALTSRYEGLPMTLLEAMTYEVPIVSFDIDTGPDDIICDGVNGFLIPPFDCNQMSEKLGLLMEQEELRTQFEKATQKEIEKFQLDDIIKNWEKLISQM